VRASRLLTLLLLLQARESMTAAGLARELGVTRRTIQRDVAALAAAGVLLQAERGPAGGYRLVGGHRTRLTGLSAQEAEALFLAGVPGPAAELGLGAVLAEAQLKLLAALPRELRGRASRASRLFHLDPGPWFSAPAAPPALLASVAGALWEGQRLALRRHGDAEARTVDPLGLVVKAGTWYLVAATPAGRRVFRVAKLAEASALPERCRRPEAFDLAGFWEDWKTEWETSLPRADVTVRVRDEAAARVRRMVEPARRPLIVEAPSAEPGWQVLTVPFEKLAYAESELLRLGAAVEVLEPAALRERMAAVARELAALYADQRAAATIAP
jgi:predicted DNA-binding transcriptional regulator YafY